MIQEKKTLTCDRPLPRWLDETTKHTTEATYMHGFVLAHDDKQLQSHIFRPSCPNGSGSLPRLRVARSPTTGTATACVGEQLAYTEMALIAIK